MKTVCDKQQQVVNVTSDTLITNKACFLCSAICHGIFAPGGYIVFYNGISVAGKTKLRIVIGRYRNLVAVFKQPIYFDRGLYIDLEGTNEQVVVGYKLAFNKG